MSASVHVSDDGIPVARVRSTYLSALENAGVIPIVAAPLLDAGSAAALLGRSDGLVLTGGADVSPLLYGASPHPRLGAVSDTRDAWEIALVRAAAALNLPVLAICRGVQILNVALGGTLIQDLPSERPSDINHDPETARTTRSHSVDVVAESRLGRAIGLTELDVNSVHHQAIDRVADSLRVTAVARDGVIEGAETAAASDWWCVGVQWHPEDIASEAQSPDRALFRAFAQALAARCER